MENSKETVPAATDTGLETVALERYDLDYHGICGEDAFVGRDANGQYVRFSQAVELLAAERERSLFLKTAMEIAQTHCGLKDKTIDSLEAKLAAAEEVAQLVIQAEEDKSGDPNFYILMMQTAYDKARAVLGGKS